ncbi:hypothetical protein Glove_11g69 [Diversispora epigaea]|uniref:Uncharacterized protein n=1 Tax=Diversispora epigaea TaxID=1348612 RepID=A0A397JXY4_9GLOM|nr:hypothetical protein Glove_11g69 [Diversispora epigaea]
MLLFNNNNEHKYKSVESNKESRVVEDDKRENGDNSIIRTHSRPPTPAKKSSPPMSTRTRRHSFISPEEKHFSSAKGISYNMHPTKVVTTADAAAVLAASLAPLAPHLNYDKKSHHQHQHQSHSHHKYTSEEKSLKSPQKTLKRSISFNHSNRPVSPRQTNIDVAEVLATTVSFLRENNRKLDWVSDEFRNDGFSSDNDSYLSDDSTDSCSNPDSYNNSESNKELVSDLKSLSFELESVKRRYREQINGKDQLIEGFKHTLKQFEIDNQRKDDQIAEQMKRIEKDKRKRDQLKIQLDASRSAIAELAEQRQKLLVSIDVDQVKILEQELENKNKTINDLGDQIARNTKDLDEKEKLLNEQLQKYETLEAQLKDNQNQLNILSKKETEVTEKDSLIESLNIRLDTSQKVIAELREKHAPHDLLRQLRQKDYIIDNLTQRVENIDADMKDRDDEIESLSVSLETQTKKAEKLKEQNSQIEPLKKSVEESEERILDIQQQLSQKERTLADLERRYKEASRNSLDGMDRLRAQDQTISNLRRDILQLRQALTAQAAEVREKDRLLSSLRDETVHVRSNYQGLINAINEKDQRITQFEQLLENLKKEVKPEPTEKEVKTNSKNEVRLNALQKVLTNKIETCRDYEKKILDFEKEIEDLKKMIDESTTSNSEKENRMTRLVKMNRQLKDEVTELKQKMEAKEQELITIKSRIPMPTSGKSPASSVRSLNKTPKSRVSSMYSVSGGESSSDETANGSRIRKNPSLSGLSSVSTTSTRRLSDNTRPALTRTRSSASTSSSSSSIQSARRSNLSTLPKTRTPPSQSTVDVLKKKRDSTITPKKEPSPINRSAVNQRKRDMVVLNTMLSGVSSDRKNKTSPLATQKNVNTKSGVAKKKLTDIVSSDSEREVKSGLSKKPSNDLTTIMEKFCKSDDSTAKGTRSKAIKVSKPPTSPVKTRTSLVRPLPSKKPPTV